MSKHLPCPFCGSTDLTSNTWSMDEGEKPAIECNNCYAGAPTDVWDRRELPPEGAEFQFEGKTWTVTDHSYSGFGYSELKITLERTDLEKPEDVESFELTAG